MAEDDTDTKLALLASLLEPATFPIEAYVEALSSADGEVGKAAEELLLPRVKSAGKRKAGASLESWLGRKKGTPASRHDRSEACEQVAQGDQAVKGEVKPVTPLSTLLRQPSTPPKIKPKATPQSALNLTSQAAIDAHDLPLTLLSSPLSASFASALYLAMMTESESWPRHRWYLAGRWVESPHLMSGYRRADGGFQDEEGKAKYYYSGSELPKPQVGLASYETDN
jgi:hypothetical protein